MTVEVCFVTAGTTNAAGLDILEEVNRRNAVLVLYDLIMEPAGVCTSV
jgi:hypothetical protein